MYKSSNRSSGGSYGNRGPAGRTGGARGNYGKQDSSERGGPRGRGGESQDGRGGRFVRKKVCRLCGERASGVDFKDSDRLLKFMTEKGKILPQRISGNCARHQRMLSKAVKRARHASLISFQIG